MDSPPPDTDYDTEDMDYDGSVLGSSEQMDGDGDSNSADASDDAISMGSGKYIALYSKIHILSRFSKNMRWQGMLTTSMQSRTGVAGQIGSLAPGKHYSYSNTSESHC